MVELPVLALALGLDSFRVSLALGAAGVADGLELRIALSFALSDALALVLGLALGHSLMSLAGPWTGRLGPLVIGAYAFYLLSLGRMRQCETRLGSWLIVAIPLSLSLDNLVVGAALGGLRLPLLLVALTGGITSGLLALTGLALGRKTVSPLRVRPELVGAMLLLVTALSLGADRL